MMRALQILVWTAGLASFIANILIGNSIAQDVNRALGTDYSGIWNLHGNAIWKDHERLFPASPKRVAFATALVFAFGLYVAAAVLAR
jgi:hypothetical protein